MSAVAANTQDYGGEPRDAVTREMQRGSAAERREQGQPPFAIGELLAGQFEVQTLLGAGGMAFVYEALDRQLGRRVALKVARAGHGAAVLAEGRALGALRHPGVVDVHSVGVHEGVEFLVLERLFGVDLATRLRQRAVERRPYTLVEVLELLASLAETLAVVHRAGLAHRDLKPSNVMLTTDGRAVLLDFGIAAAECVDAERGRRAGTLEYLAPEVLEGSIAEGPRVDLFALGAVAYELLTGRTPWTGGSVEDFLSSARGPLVPLAELRPGLPEGVEGLVEELLALDPSQRPESADTIVWQLHSLLAAERDRPHPGSLTALVVDDDPLMTELLRGVASRALSTTDVSVAHDGAEALERLRARPVDVLVLDLEMPETTGIELLFLLRGSTRPRFKHVVVVSGRASRGDITLLQRLGAVSFLPKGPALVAELEAHLHRLRAQHELTARGAGPVRRPSRIGL